MITWVWCDEECFVIVVDALLLVKKPSFHVITILLITPLNTYSYVRIYPCIHDSH